MFLSKLAGAAAGCMIASTGPVWGADIGGQPAVEINRHTYACVANLYMNTRYFA